MLFASPVLAAAPPPGEVQQAVVILGRTAADPDGKDIGRLIDVLVGEHGQPETAIIDFGGFLGVGSRKIAVQWSMLHFAPTDPKRPITLSLTQDQIKAAPKYRDVTKPTPVMVAPAAARQ